MPAGRPVVAPTMVPGSWLVTPPTHESGTPYYRLRRRYTSHCAISESWMCSLKQYNEHWVIADTWCKKTGLAVNPSKTDMVVLIRRYDWGTTSTLKQEGQQLKIAYQAKYLVDLPDKKPRHHLFDNKYRVSLSIREELANSEEHLRSDWNNWFNDGSKDKQRLWSYSNVPTRHRNMTIKEIFAFAQTTRLL